MRIWWCQEHEAGQQGESLICPVYAGSVMVVETMSPCRMVPMRLIPDNAETVDREALIAALAASRESWGINYEHSTVIIAAARAWLALDGETP